MRVPRRACGAVQEGSLLKCDICGKHFKRREYLRGHVVLFMKGVWSSVMFVRSTSEEGITWGSIWCCSRRGFFSTVMFVGRAAAMGTTLRGI